MAHQGHSLSHKEVVFSPIAVFVLSMQQPFDLQYNILWG